MPEFEGKRVVIMGLGRFGGGIGVTRWLHDQRARLLVTDLASETDLADSLSAIADLHLDRRLGEHDEASLEGCDLLVVSPAVDKRKSEFFQEAVRRGIPWTSEMSLFLGRCRGRVVGVTGSVGKSTTTAMISAILMSASRESGWRHGRVWMGGNIGKSLLHDLDSIRPDDIVILELSSFQLEDAGHLNRSPSIALVTNIRDNHLDRHGTLAAYADAKANVFRHQSPSDWLALPFEGGVELLPDTWQDRPRLYRFGVDAQRGHALVRCRNNAEYETESIDVHLGVPGLHNVQNAAAALCIGRILGVADAMALPALAGFAGLPHRLEFVRDHEGVRYYNDSKATSPEAAMTSLQAFDQPAVVLVGGSDKGSSFEAFGRSLAARAKAVVCVGQTRERIECEIRRASNARTAPIINTTKDFTEGVRATRSLADRGDVVLLIPGCASFDSFRNYEQRGDCFRRIVQSWD